MEKTTAEIIDYQNNWKKVLNSARVTVGKDQLDKEPSSPWKKRILLAEHSPIRKLVFDFKWKNLLSWVSVHFVRHKIGIEHFVKSQRTDRTGIDRNELKQSELITHEIYLNAQTLITISRKRLCKQASLETREAWKLILENLKENEKELFDVCVPECIYRGGHCPELKCCGWIKTPEAKQLLDQYWDGCEKVTEKIGV